MTRIFANNKFYSVTRSKFFEFAFPFFFISLSSACFSRKQPIRDIESVLSRTFYQALFECKIRKAFSKRFGVKFKFQISRIYTRTRVYRGRYLRYLQRFLLSKVSYRERAKNFSLFCLYFSFFDAGSTTYLILYSLLDRVFWNLVNIVTSACGLNNFVPSAFILVWYAVVFYIL